MASFTTQQPNLREVGALVTLQIGLQPAAEQVLRDAGQAVVPPTPVQAQIDTGATLTMIAPGIAAGLGLQPVGMAKISTASHADIPCPQYAVRIAFPNNVFVDAVVTEAPFLAQPIQGLIGRDILSQGVFVYIGYAGVFSLSF